MAKSFNIYVGKVARTPRTTYYPKQNLLCEGDLLCHKCYMQYISNPVEKAKQQLKQKRHAKPPSNATEHSSRRVLTSVQPQPRALRSTHIAIPTNIYEQQQVELASLHDVVKKQQSELDSLREQVLNTQEQLANEMQKCSDISK
ncbi:16615_t:CDS:1, partial [Funneliformis geosporum]